VAHRPEASCSGEVPDLRRNYAADLLAADGQEDAGGAHDGGQVLGEGLHSMDADEDMLAAKNEDSLRKVVAVTLFTKKLHSRLSNTFGRIAH
jgi:hypothetical protein